MMVDVYEMDSCDLIDDPRSVKPSWRRPRCRRVAGCDRYTTGDIHGSSGWMNTGFRPYLLTRTVGVSVYPCAIA